MQSALRLATALLVLSLTLAAHALTFRAASDPYPPYGDPKHPDGGLGIEIIRAAYKTQGHDVTMDYVPWARAVEGVKKGNYDILPFTWKTDAREKLLLFSAPLAVGNVRFIKRKGDPFNFHGLESLEGKHIGVIHRYGYSVAFVKSTGFVRENGSSLATNVHKLLLKRLDLTVEDETVARAALFAEDPALLEQIEFVKTPLAVNPLYISAGLQNPRAQEIISAFNKGLEIIKANGTYDRIFKKYGVERSVR
nr:transporter substrate-binding domain-containing protein [uncultured Rhodoferax sp.]